MGILWLWHQHCQTSGSQIQNHTKWVIWLLHALWSTAFSLCALWQWGFLLFWCCLFTKYNGGLWIQIWLFLFLTVSFFLFCCFLFFLSLSRIHGAKWALKTSKCFSHYLVLQAVDTIELLVFQSRVETRNAFHSERNSHTNKESFKFCVQHLYSVWFIWFNRLWD